MLLNVKQISGFGKVRENYAMITLLGASLLVLAAVLGAGIDKLVSC